MRAPPYNRLAASIVGVLGAVLWLVAAAETDPPELPRKDAAEAVGEGNTARWLDYYRRERGQGWAQPSNEGAQKPNSPQDEPDAPYPAPPPRNQ
jgi:hypothetical protein